jgi:arsenate reductase-like glutaredoxin family protein
MKTPIVLTLLAAAVGFAQPPAATPSFTELKTYLNLSDTQLNSITAANTAARTANRALADQAHTKQQALQTTITNGSTDAAAIGKAVLEIAAIRKQLDAAQPTKPATNTPADTPAQGWQALANRRGPTWRKVAEAATPAELGQARTLALLCDNTSAIRRPILERDGKDLLLGFDAPAWAKTLDK